MNQDKPKEQFGSFLGFLMVAIGFAVGVGSLWRFPYICGANGGAVFIMVYIALILLIGVPLLTAEISVGFFSKKTPVAAYRSIAPGTKWHLGAYLHIAAALFIVGYTAPIYAWILHYLYITATGGLAGMDAGQLGEHFGALTTNFPLVILFALINFGINIVIVKGGLEKGVERVCKLLLPLLAAIMLVIIIYGMRLPGAEAGVSFLLKPDFSKFTAESLLTALGMAFFAIGIGMLASMVFGSYIRNPRENIMKSAGYICGAIIVAGVAAGFMIFPMVFAFGLEPAAGPGLTFITLPNVFNQIPGGRVIGTLFYLGFYIAALTSSAGVLEALVGALKDRFDISRGLALTIAAGLIVAIGMGSIVNGPFFDFMDNLTSNYVIVIGAFIIAVFVGWIWGVENFLKAVNVESDFAKLWLKVCVKYLSPVVIFVIFIARYF